MSSSDRILLTGGRAPVAVELARQFAAGGATVVVADSASHWLTRASRAVERAYRVPAPRERPQAFAAAIADIVQRERITRIVPTCEEVFYLAGCSSTLRQLTELFCPSLDVLRVLHNKWSLGRLASGLGVEVPQAWLLQSAADLAQLPLRPADLVVKPVFSRFAVQTLVRPRPQQLLRVRPTPERPWLAQRYVAGRELCSYAVARDGRLTAHVAYAPTWRAGQHGSSFYFSPVDCAPLERFVAQLVARVHYTGQLGVDVIQTPHGTLYLLECNPRATSGVHLFSAADRLTSAFDGTTGEVLHPTTHQPRMLASAMLLLGPPQALRSDPRWAAEKSREANFVPGARAAGGGVGVKLQSASAGLLRLVQDFRRARDVVWSADDPAPTGALFVDLAAYLGVAVRYRISPAAATTRDIEWNGQPIP